MGWEVPALVAAMGVTGGLYWFCDEDLRGEVKRGLNTVGAFTAILGSIFWVVNGKLGMVVHPTDAVSGVAAMMNLVAASLAYASALAFLPAYIVDSLGPKPPKPIDPDHHLLHLALLLCDMPKDQRQITLAKQTKTEEEAVYVQTRIDGFLASRREAAALALPKP